MQQPRLLATVLRRLWADSPRERVPWVRGLGLWALGTSCGLYFQQPWMVLLSQAACPLHPLVSARPEERRTLVHLLRAFGAAALFALVVCVHRWTAPSSLRGWFEGADPLWLWAVALSTWRRPASATGRLRWLRAASEGLGGAVTALPWLCAGASLVDDPWLSVRWVGHGALLLLGLFLLSPRGCDRSHLPQGVPCGYRTPQCPSCGRPLRLEDPPPQEPWA